MRISIDDSSCVLNKPTLLVSPAMYFLALQLKPSLSGLSAPESFSFSLTPDGETGSWLGSSVVTSPPFVFQFCRLVGAQSAAHT